MAFPRKRSAAGTRVFGGSIMVAGAGGAVAPLSFEAGVGVAPRERVVFSS